MTTIDVDSATARLLSAAASLPFPHELVVLASRLAQAGAPESEIASTIESDPDLANRLIAVARAGILGAGERPRSVLETCQVFGTHKATSVVTALAYSNLCRPAKGEAALFFQHLSTRALVSGVAARALAQRTDAAPDHVAFVAGLLIGSGQLVAARALPELYAEVLQAAPDVLPSPRIEREYFGFDHGVLDAALAREWGLPNWVSAAVGAATSPDRLPLSAGDRALRLAEILHTAYLAARVVCDRDEGAAMMELSAALEQRVSLHGSAAPVFLRTLTANVHEISQLFDLRQHRTLDLDQISNDAIDAATALHERTASAEGEKGESRGLLVSTEGLPIDEVTGLPSAANLPYLTQQAFERQNAAGLPASVGILVIELDGLEIERAGGSGDGLLREVASRLTKDVRGSDVLVRAGGDRLVLVAPTTSTVTLGFVAERLRQTVRTGGADGTLGTRTLTISVGGACSEGIRRAGERELLLREAAAECTAAKAAGGDRCHIRSDF